MYFENGIGEAVADILSDVCRIAGVSLDREHCVAEVTPDSNVITKKVVFEFIDSDIIVRVEMVNVDGVDNTYNVAIYGADDTVYMEDRIEKYDLNELKKNMKDIAADKEVIISDELKSEIAGFIDDTEYSIEGTLSYKL